MNRVNLVYVEDSWILARSAKEIKRYIPEVQTNGVGEVNYFINYAQYRDVPGVSIANFTHLEEKGHWRKVFLEVARKADYCVSLCKNTAEILRENGAKNVRVIHYGVHNIKPLRLGVAGRVYPTGRKGEFLVKSILDAGYDVTALGEGWPCKSFDGSKEAFFDSIDYFVVTSLNEGGPHPVLDALAHGVPVIAPDVGWCWEFSVLRYKKGDKKSLSTVLDGLKPGYWSTWADKHKTLFAEILGERCGS